MQAEEYVILVEYNSTHGIQQRVLAVLEEVLQYLNFWHCSGLHMRIMKEHQEQPVIGDLFQKETK